LRKGCIVVSPISDVSRRADVAEAWPDFVYTFAALPVS
jgi:hypothetical protein